MTVAFNAETGDELGSYSRDAMDLVRFADNPAGSWLPWYRTARVHAPCADCMTPTSINNTPLFSFGFLLRRAPSV